MCMLTVKQLRHENLVNLIEVYCRKKHLYLVFEFVDHTVLDDLDVCPAGLDEDAVRRILWQVLKGIHFCHVHNVSYLDNALLLQSVNSMHEMPNYCRLA